MLSYKTYSQYTKFVTPEEVRDFLHGDVYSNYKNFHSMCEHLITHKSESCRNYKMRSTKPAYNNIFAHCFKILLPKKLGTSRQQDFVKTFIQAFDLRFKTLLYVYKFDVEGMATYAHIMMFTRYVYKRKIIKKITHARDYYYTSTGKLCKKETPGAILKVKKGSFQYDPNGKVLTTIRYVARKEYKIFKYTSFLAFRRAISKAIIYATLVICRETTVYKYIKSVSYISNTTISIKKYLKHQCVTRLNYELEKVQEALLHCRIDDNETKKSFYRLLYNLHHLIHKTERLKGVNISYKLPFTLFKENLLYLEQDCFKLIREFWSTYIAGVLV